jgi:membrane-bound lytic murein transglycosylase A
MTFLTKDHHKVRLPFPPQIFAVSFFLLLSSCATMETGSNGESVWDKPESQQERAEVYETPSTEKQVRYPRPVPEKPSVTPPPSRKRRESVETKMGLLPSVKNRSGHEQVSSLPSAPLYKARTRAAAPHKPEKKDQLNTRKIYPHHSLYPPLDVPAAELPDSYLDDLDPESLRESIRRQLYILEGKAPLEQVRLGDLTVTQARLYDTLVEFENLLDAELSPEEFSHEVKERFYVVPVGTGQHHRVLFTGYYTPVIPASRTWTREYHYPLYRKPSTGESVEASYERAMQSRRDYGFHLVASTRPVELTREAIDGREVLADKNLEVAWLKDQMEGYFLHIQGSGFLQFNDGELEMVQYMGSNERPYKSVGRMMINDGIITTGQGSMQGIKRYFHEHPEDIPKYLFKNERYIFFGMGGNGPRGSTGAELIGGRAIATDKKLYPGGGLVFITADKPILNANNKITDWQPFSRFVLDQDTGSAIKGRGRADLYFGIGEKAGAKAGHFMKRGKMFYLIVK